MVHRRRGGSWTVLSALCAVILSLLLPATAQDSVVQSAPPPPRTISDVTAILDQQKPDTTRRAELEAEANALPPEAGKASRGVLTKFYFKRAQSRADLGRTQDAISDIAKAHGYSSDYLDEGSRYDLLLELLLRFSGENKRAIAVLEQMSRKLDALPRTKGRQFNINRRLVMNYAALGDLGRAEVFVRKNQALFNESRSWPNVEMFRSSFEANVEAARARLLEARGRFAEAEAAYKRYVAFERDAMAKSKSWPNPPSLQGFELGIDAGTASVGRMKSRLGRVAEAENEVRKALLSRLSKVGKYHADTALMIANFSDVLRDQARFREAEALARTGNEILETLGFPEASPSRVNSLNQIAVAIAAQRRSKEAKALFVQIEEAVRDWPLERARAMRLSWSRIYAHYLTGDVSGGIALAREYVTFQKARKGAAHFDTSMARAILAAGLTYAGKDDEALVEFKHVMPLLLGSARDDEEGDLTLRLAADSRLQAVAEANMSLLARATDPQTAAIESLQIGEAIRGRSVQNALQASAARSTAKTPALGDLVRKEQDLDKQAVALVTTINQILGAPPEERDEPALQVLQSELDGLRTERSAAKREIGRRFPEYNNLINPKPVSVEDIRASLRAEEALLSFHFGRRESFAWVVPKSGPLVFTVLPTNLSDIQKRVDGLRQSLEPNASTVGEIPPFDMKAAHELYELLLKPVEAGWRPAKSLVVTTNGALGLLPLSLLPTAPSSVRPDEETLFSEYRTVPWLARTHDVSMVPSAAALRTLRQVPKVVIKRDSLVGFGDPFFSTAQATEIADAEPDKVANVTTRGLPIKMRAAARTSSFDSAEIGQLPRLPDTADELKAIATALEADPSKILHLGKSANERTVKELDLARYRVVVFATHGLVPGELNGLTQPALALTAPDVADIDGDGLLTVEEILQLRLNADWVVLSACNTGAGAGAGAEAASGLGRAFFYAGTRALLLTNWSVHSASARMLVSELFKRQGSGASITRAEALRQASMALVDGPGFVDGAGKTLFTYAHPIFWAPYSILGDGSSN